jgi:hypothetical protein
MLFKNSHQPSGTQKRWKSKHKIEQHSDDPKATTMHSFFNVPLQQSGTLYKIAQRFY